MHAGKGWLRTTYHGIVLFVHQRAIFRATRSAPRTIAAKPTACTTGSKLEGHSDKFLGVTANVFWHPATGALRTRIGLAATAPTRFLSEPTLDVWATMVYDGLGRPPLARLRMVHFFAPLLDDQGPIKISCSLAFTGLQRDACEVLGVCNYDKLARLYSVSNAT